MTATAFVVGLCGGSATGKTTVARALAARTGAAILHMDDYTMSPPAGVAVDDHDFDHPDSIDFETLLRDVDALAQGNRTRVPTYHFGHHSSRLVDPAPVLVVEGTLIFSHTDLDNVFHLRAVIDTDPEVRLARRLARDVLERNQTKAQIERRWRRFVLPAEEKFIHPHIERCDIVLREENLEDMAGLIAAHPVLARFAGRSTAA